MPIQQRSQLKGFGQSTNEKYIVEDIHDLSQSLDEILPYKVYTAVLDQNGVSAPVATVLQNTLGVTPTYSYSSEGLYIVSGITPSPFNTSKTFIVVQGGQFNVLSNIIGGGPNAGKIQIQNYDSSGLPVNASGNPIYLEIRIYN